MKDELEAGNAVLQTIHASDGNRALKLLQQRQKRQKLLQKAKSEIETMSLKKRIEPIDARYQGSAREAFEEAFKQDTVGLVTAEEFKERRKRLVAQIEEVKSQPVQPSAPVSSVPKPKRSAEKSSKLSFDLHEDDTQLEPETKRNFGKDPTIDTSFLTDSVREEQVRLERAMLIEKYKQEQDKIKEQLIEIPFMYWEGVQTKYTATVKKSYTVGQFVTLCQSILSKDIQALADVVAENLLLIKDGIILPANISFYELMRAKPQGQTGPLFKAAVVEGEQSPLREKDEGCVAKLVSKSWYEKNKHIFPASNWELYAPGKVQKTK